MLIYRRTEDVWRTLPMRSNNRASVSLVAILFLSCQAKRAKWWTEDRELHAEAVDWPLKLPNTT